MLKNRFNKGLDRDTFRSKVSPENLTDARNVEILKQGDNYAVTNMQGTELLRPALGTDPAFNVLKSLGCYGLVDGVKKRGIVYFTYEGGTTNSRIRFYDIEADQYHQLFPAPADQPLDELAFPPTGSVDAYYYADVEKHFVYWEDGANENRYIEVNINTSTPSYPLLKKLSVIPYHPIDCIRGQVLPVIDGGELLSGSYSFAYRYFSSLDCTYSGWSNFTNPIPVFPEEGFENVGGENQWGGKVGQETNKKIALELSGTLGQDGYDSIQLCVIQNVDGVKGNKSVGFITNPSQEWFTNGIEYTGTETGVETDISSILIDPIAVVSAKTMTIKDGRIFRGNFKTRDFVADNGDPTATTDVSNIKSGVDYKLPTHCERLKGYFHGEVYAYGIRYWDKFGNSVVFPYDFSAYNKLNYEEVTASFMSILADLGGGLLQAEINVSNIGLYEGGDEITLSGGIGGGEAEVFSIGPTVGPNVTVILRNSTTAPLSAGDNGTVTFRGRQHKNRGTSWAWKFPERCEHSFGLWGSGSNNPQGLGLRIEGISNHPSWAVGFEIVRLERKEDIIAQAPHIPCVAVNGRQNIDNDGITPDETYYSGVEDTYIPKVHTLGIARNIENLEFGTTSLTQWQQQNAVDGSNEIIPLAFVPNPEFVYNVDGTPHDSPDLSYGKVDICDGLLLRYDEKEHVNNGNQIERSVAVFSADGKDQYYYNDEGRIDENGDDIFFKKIEDTDGFLNSIAQQGVWVDSQKELVGSHPFVTVDNYSPNHEKYREITRYGGLKELVSVQNVDPSLAVNSVRTFMDPTEIENQRGTLLKFRSPLVDFTNTVWDENLNNNIDFFPLLGWTPDSDVIDDAFIDRVEAGAPAGVVVDDTRKAVDDGDYACASYVLNIRKGLGDERYGPVDNINGQWVSTGSWQPLSPADILAGTSFNIDVWGGDCFITKHSFKVSESTPLCVNERVGCSQRNVEIIECWLESKVNSNFIWNDGKYPSRIEVTRTGATTGPSFVSTVSPFLGKFEYHYNPGYSKGNTDKVFADKVEFCDERNDYSDAIIWSDQRVRGAVRNPLNDILGFDRYDVNNIAILDSKYGALTKLVTFDDKAIYPVQELKVGYLPIGVDELATQDGVLIATGTGGVLGNGQFYFSYDFGSQHIRTIEGHDGFFYAIDALRKQVFRFGPRGGGFKVISMFGMEKEFRSILASDFDERELMLHIDTVRDRVVVHFSSLVDERASWMFNYKAEFWETSTTNRTPIFNGISVDGRLFWISSTGSLWGMYEGDFNSIFAESADSSFQFAVSHDEDAVKVFKVIEVSATEKVRDITCQVFNQEELGVTQFTGALPTNFRNKGYFVNKLRDVGTNARLRGKTMLVTVSIDQTGASVPGQRQTSVSSVLTKIRKSHG